MLIIIGLIIKYFWWIVGVLAIVAACWLGSVIVRESVRRSQEAEKRRRHQQARLIAQADKQHAWVLDGDSRGIYGVEGAEYMRYIERDNWDGLARHLQKPPGIL
ncbi:hypothetical protein AWB99_17605 [Mycolicibacterium confluentis]|nr:hypothetical protein [Mycolicibacterium confluentis]ORV28430.1 hypothetical protein AWB99_17605 [Mycolicibacterium confluentis]